MEDEHTQAFNQISDDSNRISTLCHLAIDPADSKTDPDIQTVLYMILDYADSIKLLSNKMMG